MAADSALRRLQYVSRARDGLDDAAVGAIIDWSGEYNPRVGVTGLLLFTGPHFSQILEGPAQAVDALFDSIQRDDRHRWHVSG